jgi:hypothetical protein
MSWAGWFLLVYMKGAAFLPMQSLDACLTAAAQLENTAMYAVCVHPDGSVVKPEKRLPLVKRNAQP